MTELELTLETMERDALADLHAAAPPELRQRLGMRGEVVDGCLVSVCAASPSIVINRALGLGVYQPATADTVSTVLKLYEQAGVTRFFVNLHEQAKPAELPGWLRAAGLKPYRRWVQFTRDASPPSPAKTDLQVREIGPEHGMDFARIVAYGYGVGDEAAPALAQLVGRPSWRSFMCFDGDTPAGATSLFIKDRIGCVNWAATAPAHLTGGAPSALLTRCIEVARESGCEMLITSTGEAVPGDPQHSYHNLERAGFQAVYARDNYVPA